MQSRLRGINSSRIWPFAENYHAGALRETVIVRMDVIRLLQGNEGLAVPALSFFAFS
jgi:hypothetical protein